MKQSVDPHDLAPYLSDESRYPGGSAEQLLAPCSAVEVCDAVRDAAVRARPLTVSGAGTGLTGGRVPRGGVVLSTELLRGIEPADADPRTGQPRLCVGAGTALSALMEAAQRCGAWYPPDPTEWSATLGGTIATNASGARTFGMGPTRAWVSGLRLALADGSLLALERGQIMAQGSGEDAHFELPTAGGTRHVPAPNWEMPATSKNAAGYFSAPGMDLVDLFVGSEGTLGVIIDAVVTLAPRPAEFFSAIFFFAGEPACLAFVEAARDAAPPLAPLSLEFFDGRALELLRRRGVAIPADAAGAIFVEQAIAQRAGAASVHDAWLELAAAHAAADGSWISSGAEDLARFRAFRHDVPTAINETNRRRGVGKIGTDTAVPRGRLAELLARYRALLAKHELEHAAFGHIGNDHLHVNIMARDAGQYARGREIYHSMVREAVAMGGTISAEHGLGKLKADDLALMYGPAVLARMAAIKRALDPQWILGRGTMLVEPED